MSVSDNADAGRYKGSPFLHTTNTVDNPKPFVLILQVRVAEATKKAQEAFKETVERETMEMEEWNQKEVEYKIEQKEALEKAKTTLQEAELKAFKRHLKKLEMKRRRKRPMKGSIMVRGKLLETPEEGVRQPHSAIGGMAELLGRIKVREKERVDWTKAREK